jgi:NAD(P)-dependent dehydrogenase (short-subunit alcohol dehydrogenase family)
MANRLGGKTALVAGGTGGLGRAVSSAFLKEGARVLVTYRSEDEFSALKRGEDANSHSLEGFQADVTNFTEVAELVEKIGVLDILVNTVGAYSGGSPLWQTNVETFERMMSLNVRSGFILARGVVPVMLRRGSGTIVNISSRSAVDHAAGASAYAASKAAALAMMDSLAADLKGTGVRVNTVLPSIIDTEANRNAMPGADYANWPKPEQIADVILFLCEDAAKLIHGAAVPVYGIN